jgi:hypothetical protein
MSTVSFLKKQPTHFDTIIISMDLCKATEALSDSKLPRSEDDSVRSLLINVTYSIQGSSLP